LLQKIVEHASFFALLLDIDREMAEECRGQGCSYCGGRLHQAPYWRKPRGGPAGLAVQMDKRFSFCCSRPGCRRRATPASVRFLGRKVYFGAVMVLACVLCHGITERRASQLRERLGVGRRTLERWRQWWHERFSQSGFWKAGRGRFMPPVEEGSLPGSLLRRFGGDPRRRLLKFLRWLSPITPPSAQVF